MEKETLKDYKYKITNLSEEELNKRLEYLKNMATGKLQGPMTGYPTVDMPQIANYDLNKINSVSIEGNIVDVLYNNNKDNMDLTALSYFGSKITYGKFFKRKDEIAAALIANNVKEGDTVPVFMVSMPESMISVFSFAQIGAIGLFMPPHMNRETVIQDMQKKNSKIAFIMDTFYEMKPEYFDGIYDEAGIEKIVVVPVLNSSPLGKIKKKKEYSNPKIQLFNDFIKEGKNINEIPTAEYEKDKPVAVVYSSGTSGFYKGVTLSHDSFNNSAQSYVAFGFDLSKGQKVYQAIPLWASTGLIADGTSALYYGCELVQNPKFEPLVYSKNLGKYRINWGIATTELFNGLVDLKEEKGFKLKNKLGLLDYSQLNNVYIGGTLSTPNDKAKLNDILSSVGCSAKVKASYGTCENGSIVTAELNGKDYPNYSVGIPIPGVKVMIVDEYNNELPCGERGEITVSTNCGMVEYFNNKELNDKIFFTDETGQNLYKHTGDVGYITKDGILIYCGRAKDYSLINEEKIYNFDVKRVILENENVVDCEVFALEENILCANIIFKDGMTDYEKELSLMQESLYLEYQDEHYVPEYFKIRKEFPMAKSTKRDYDRIKAEKDGYIYIKNNNKNKVRTLK